MSAKEIDHYTVHYEFEDRAQLFVEDTKKLAKRFTSIEVVIENLTDAKIRELGKSIREASGKSLDQGIKTQLLNELYRSDYELQNETAAGTAVIVKVFAHSSRPLTNFELKTDALARAFRGVRRINDDDDGVEDKGDEVEEDYRFAATIIYDFKNDFK